MEEMISGRPLLLSQKQTTFEIPALFGGGRKSRGNGGCFSLSAVTTSDVGVITLSSDAIILTAEVTSPTKSMELTIFLKSVAHEGGRLVFFGRTADRPRRM